MITKYKNALSNYPTGIFCVFSKDKKEKYNCIIVNSFSSVSLKPLLVLWCLDKKSSKLHFFRKSKNQIIALLSDDQKKIVKKYAYANKNLNEIELSNILKKSIFSLNCKKVKEIIAGDHFVIFLKVLKISDIRKVKPIIYYKKKLVTI